MHRYVITLSAMFGRDHVIRGWNNFMFVFNYCGLRLSKLALYLYYHVCGYLGNNINVNIFMLLFSYNIDVYQFYFDNLIHL